MSLHAAGRDARRMTANAVATMSERDIPGWRVVRRIGPLRLLRWVALAYLFAHVGRLALLEGAALLDPAVPGTDIANYYAAGQRLRDLHPLYELSPGDWPVPLAPPYVTVPLLSPPLMAVMWRPLATFLPAEVAIGAWFVAVFSIFLTTVVWQVMTGSAARVLLIMVLAPSIALTALSGDINGLLAPLLIGAWYWFAQGRPAASGAAIAVAGALKLTPAFLAWWLVAQRSRHGIAAFVAVLAVCAMVAIVGSTVQDHFAYLDVIRHTSVAGYSAWSLAGYVNGAGIPAPGPTLALAAVGMCGAIGVYALRSRPGMSWSVAVATSVFAGPVVHLITLSLLLPALAPYDDATAKEPKRASS